MRYKEKPSGSGPSALVSMVLALVLVLLTSVPIYLWKNDLSWTVGGPVYITKPSGGTTIVITKAGVERPGWLAALCALLWLPGTKTYEVFEPQMAAGAKVHPLVSFLIPFFVNLAAWSAAIHALRMIWRSRLEA